MPVILPGAAVEPTLPTFLQQTLWVDMRDWQSAGNDSLGRLACGILGRAPGDSSRVRIKVGDVWDFQNGT